MPISTDFLTRCIDTLEPASDERQRRRPDDAFHDIFRAAAVTEFDIILEQCESLLRKPLRPFFASNRQADRLTFKDAFRHAAKHGLITVEVGERWFLYRNNRNDTAHNYCEGFAETTLKLPPEFVRDAKQLAGVLAEGADD